MSGGPTPHVDDHSPRESTRQSWTFLFTGRFPASSLGSSWAFRPRFPGRQRMLLRPLPGHLPSRRRNFPSSIRSGGITRSRKACPTTTFLPSRPTAPGSGSARKMAWPAWTRRTGEIRSWREKDGLPWRVITAIDVDKKTGDVWLGLFGGGLARFSGGRLRSFQPAQQRAGQRRGLRRRRGEQQHLGGNYGRGKPLQRRRRTVDDLYREKRPHGGDLELRRVVRQGQRQGLPGRLGKRGPGVRHRHRALEALPRPRQRNGNRLVSR